MAFLVQRDDLAVQHRRSPQALQLVRDCGESLVEGVVPSRVKRHATRAVDLGNDAKPIQLDFKDPALSVKRLFHESGEHRGEWHRVWSTVRIAAQISCRN